MKLSYNWLKQYVDLSGITPEELAERLTRSGVEVEGVEHRNQGVSQIVIGYVKDISKHPDADKLSVCLVDVGEEEQLQIVCGAENVAAEQHVVVSKIGAVLPGDFKIKKAKLRGIESSGMICSATELGINDKLLAKSDQEGILVLPEDVIVGEDAIAYLGLDDVILDLDLTPNRSDCLSMLGVAYEVAAILDRSIQLPSFDVPEEGETIEGKVNISILAPEDCSNYSARLITNIQLGPSPQWMQNCLMAADIRPINNIVDITNYVMLEQGQPLHAFDYEQINNGNIVVRLAEEGEQFVTLDGIERNLDDEMLLITDGQKPIALAGVMGGSDSEVSQQTTTILLESAHFSAMSVRKTAKKLGLRSEASLRFEKGADPEAVAKALDRAAFFMSELAGGQVAKGVVMDETKEHHRLNVTLRLGRLNALLGTELKMDEVESIFHRLYFPFTVGEQIVVEVPSRRQDITREVDLIEEIARLHGYDHIPTTLPSGSTTRGQLSHYQAWLREVRGGLVGVGLHEVSTYSFTQESLMYDFASLDRETEGIQLSMPMSEERARLRVNLLPHLLETAAYNNNRQIHDVAIFEIGRVFISDKTTDLTELPEEKLGVAGLITGDRTADHWSQPAQPVDFYTLKGVLDSLFQSHGLESVDYRATHDLKGMHPGRTAQIFADNSFIGYIGQVHPQLEKKYDIGESYVFYLDLEKMYHRLPAETHYDPLPRYPSTSRDLSIVVAQEIMADELAKLIVKEAGPLLESVKLFDVYTGDKVAPGKKSLTFALIFRKWESTLIDEEVNKVHEQIVTALADTYQAELRM